MPKGAVKSFSFCKTKHLHNLNRIQLNRGPRKMKRTPKPRCSILSATAIARKIRRSPQGVMDVIKRLGIAPEVSLPSGKYYAEDSVRQISEAMRRPNGANQEEG